MVIYYQCTELVVSVVEEYVILSSIQTIQNWAGIPRENYLSEHNIWRTCRSLDLDGGE